MQREFRRYAIYFAPRPASALGRFGAAWLGWDAERGVDCAGLPLAGLPRPREEIVAGPRKYGFHGTLKAPFRLAENVTAAELDDAVGALAAATVAFALPMRLSALGPFLALVPVGASAALAQLAADCVTRLDRFRAPLSPEEVARRRSAGLTADEQANLALWGYPYVLDAFQFHLTLTGSLGRRERDLTSAALRRALAPALAQPMDVADLCLFGEDGQGAFHVVARRALAS